MKPLVVTYKPFIKYALLENDTSPKLDPYLGRRLSKQTACELTNKSVHREVERPFMTERGLSQEKQTGHLENPIKQLTGWAASQTHGKVPCEGRGVQADLLGSLPSCIDTGERKWWFVEERTSPCPHQLHNYSHWGAWGHKLSIWEVLTHDPIRRTRERLGIWWSVQIPDWPGLINALYRHCVWHLSAFKPKSYRKYIDTAFKVTKIKINRASIYSLYRNNLNWLLEDSLFVFKASSPNSTAADNVHTHSASLIKSWERLLEFVVWIRSLHL